jgi:hypothetical protein
MTIVSSGSPSAVDESGMASQRAGAGIRTPAAMMSRTIDFRRAYFHAIMMPVHVDTASASTAAAKNIFVGSELGGGVAGDACVGFGISSFGPSGFAPSDLVELDGATLRRGR